MAHSYEVHYSETAASATTSITDARVELIGIIATNQHASTNLLLEIEDVNGGNYFAVGLAALTSWNSPDWMKGTIVNGLKVTATGVTAYATIFYRKVDEE